MYRTPWKAKKEAKKWRWRDRSEKCPSAGHMEELPWEHQAASSGRTAHGVGEGTGGLAAMTRLGWMLWCAGPSQPG